ncbi:MAG: transcriptional regulator [Candidatus Angelobacter sp.]|jgi:AcrR family transcriptional regulator|nr:transcriptional regulator [Candidatus Angelobacter sp.]
MSLATRLQVPGRRQRRREETEQRILSAAVRLFEKQGYTSTTVEQITEAADVGKGTFFNYFPSKDHILLSLFGMLRVEFDHLEREAREVTDVRAHLRAFARRIVTAHGRPNILRNVIGIAMTEPLIGTAFESLVKRARGAVTRILEQGLRMNQVRTDVPVEILARNFQQFIFGTQVLYSINGGKEDLQEWLDAMFELFWNGAATRPSSAKQKQKKAKRK